MKYIFFNLSAVLFAILGNSQVVPGELQSLLSSPQKLKEYRIDDIEEVQQFYLLNNYQPAWMTAAGRADHAILSKIIRNANRQALEPCDYADALLGEEDVCIVITEPIDSLVLELRITSAAIRLYKAIASGNQAPRFEYDGLGHTSPGSMIVIQLLQALRSHDLPGLVTAFNSSMPQIRPMLAEIDWYLDALKKMDYREEKIVSSKVNTGNKPLCRKLYYLGCTDSLISSGADTIVSKGIKRAQEKFNLLNDGVLRGTTITELNIPLMERLRRLNMAVNYYRWVYAISVQQPVIVVNIPAAYLKVYQSGSVILDMKLVVGKPSTPTPQLTSKVIEVILYPYWVVPSSIITNEILPVLRKNPGYLNANNFQVLDRRGKVLDPYNIDWNNISASRFPYMIRQRTGCDNSLGILKLNFYNPFTVYLHDTPKKSLFMTQKRYYSHGCMRMEKPVELGRLVLGSNSMAIDTMISKGCLKNQPPVYLPAAVKYAVVVWYNPADIAADGRLVYFEDVYRKWNNGSTAWPVKK